jgi:hypothetical protein
VHLLSANSIIQTNYDYTCKRYKEKSLKGRHNCTNYFCVLESSRWLCNLKLAALIQWKLSRVHNHLAISIFKHLAISVSYIFSEKSILLKTSFKIFSMRSWKSPSNTNEKYDVRIHNFTIIRTIRRHKLMLRTIFHALYTSRWIQYRCLCNIFLLTEFATAYL